MARKLFSKHERGGTQQGPFSIVFRAVLAETICPYGLIVDFMKNGIEITHRPHVTFCFIVLTRIRLGAAASVDFKHVRQEDGLSQKWIASDIGHLEPGSDTSSAVGISQQKTDTQNQAQQATKGFFEALLCGPLGDQI